MTRGSTVTVRDATRALLRELGLTTAFGNPGTTRSRRHGCAAVSVDDPGGLPDALEGAFAADAPVLAHVPVGRTTEGLY